MDKENVVYNGILCSNKWNIDICYNMKESWKHAKWEKPGTESYIAWFHVTEYIYTEWLPYVKHCSWTWGLMTKYNRLDNYPLEQKKLEKHDCAHN